MNRVYLFSVGCVAALALSSAHASLVSRDLFDPGDALLTLDTETGLQWLDFTVCPGSTLGGFWSGACGLQELGFQTKITSSLVDMSAAYQDKTTIG